MTHCDKKKRERIGYKCHRWHFYRISYSDFKGKKIAKGTP